MSSEHQEKRKRYADNTAKARAAKAAAKNSVTGAVKAADPETVKKINAVLGDMYSLIDVAAALGVTTRSVLTYLHTGKLEGVKIGGQWRISAEALRRFAKVIPSDITPDD